ncbi:MAG: site-specific DNA-methyltransferase [Patescibacteria group bacterium]
MKKNHKLEAQSYLPEKDLKEFLKKSFPSVFSEGKISCEKLKSVLGENYQSANEQYGLSWAGKNDCFREIQETTTATLKPNKKESVDFDETSNLFIEGDNLEAMKVLQRSYYGKVKCIYIDPPYNTGGDFIYNDSFKMESKAYNEASGAADVEGNTVRADGLSINRKDSNGRFHSDWLNMMYPRLFLARSLLRQDGVIFVSIDDNEVHNLRMIMDEIFGEENFVESFIWRSRLGKGSTSVETATLHEYIICYAKNKDDISFSSDIRVKEGMQKERLRQWGQGDKKEDRPSMFFPLNSKEFGDVYPIKPDGSEGRWRASKEKVEEMMREQLIVFEKQKDGRIEAYRIIPAGSETKTAHDSILDSSVVKTTAHGSKELKKLFNENFFDYPKPTTLIKQLLSFVSLDDDDMILDFFAGSGTTAQAVMEQNAEDGGNRKWICIQLPEFCEENSEAFKVGYKNIAEITKERIRRAASAIATASQGGEKELDIGFKSFKLDKSNFKIWQGKIKNKEDLIGQMEMFIDNVKENSSQENILHELILKSGLELDVDIKEEEFKNPVSAKATAGKEKYYNLADGKLLVYLGENISIEMGEYLQNQKPEKIICLERAFQNNDNLKTNILLQAEQEGVDFKVV